MDAGEYSNQQESIEESQEETKKENSWFLIPKAYLEGYPSKAAAMKALNAKENPGDFVPVRGKARVPQEKTSVTF